MTINELKNKLIEKGIVSKNRPDEWLYIDSVDDVLEVIQKSNREVDSMLVELWNFFALEKDHHGKQRATGNIPSLNRLHYFVKSRGLIKGTGQFTEEGKLHLSQLNKGNDYDNK